MSRAKKATGVAAELELLHRMLVRDCALPVNIMIEDRRARPAVLADVARQSRIAAELAEKILASLARTNNLDPP